MTNRRKILITGGAVAALAAGGAGVAVATGGDDNEVPIKGADLEKASAAALEFTGEGSVAETEAGDEESYYEVEVALDDGSSVDVQLNRGFEVVGDETDGAGEDDEAGEEE